MIPNQVFYFHRQFGTDLLLWTDLTYDGDDAPVFSRSRTKVSYFSKTVIEIDCRLHSTQHTMCVTFEHENKFLCHLWSCLKRMRLQRVCCVEENEKPSGNWNCRAQIEQQFFAPPLTIILSFKWRRCYNLPASRQASGNDLILNLTCARCDIGKSCFQGISIKAFSTLRVESSRWKCIQKCGRDRRRIDCRTNLCGLEMLQL